ncbi:MAG: methyltransferase family protein [Candidatus Sulfotelmatobacter sp.]
MKNPFRVLMYIPVPWVFVLCYLVGGGLGRLHPTDFFASAARASNIAGAVLFALGAVIAGWGWMLFRVARTTTVPGQASAKLVDYGPYRFTRNPMYIGLTLAYLGEAGLLKQPWPVVVLPFVIAYLNWIVIPVEEAKLAEVFPGDYERYRSQVRRWF